MVTDEMVEKAMLSLYGSDFYDDWDRNTSFVVNREVGMRAALEAALSAAEPVGEVAGQQGRYWMTDEGRWSNWFDITFNTWVPEPGVREVRNLYAAPPAPSVAVKELEWSPRNDQPQYEVCADTPFGRYKTSNKGEYGFGWMQPRQTVWSGFLPTLEEAKAAAQSHYESRIRSALSAQVQDVAGSALQSEGR